MKQKHWIIIFLSSIGLSVGLELLAVFDKVPETVTLTYLIVTYIPAWLGFPAVVAFAGWLIYHFGDYYGLKDKLRRVIKNYA